MREDIKNRIEAVRAGKVPANYKRTDSGIMPEAWMDSTVGDIIEFHNEKSTINNEYPVLTSARSGLVLQTEYFEGQVTREENAGYNVMPYGYITYRSRSDDGRFTFNQNTVVSKGIVSCFYPVFRVKEESAVPEFVLSYLNNYLGRQIVKEIVGTSQLVLSEKKLSELRMPCPPFAEQQKIAEILATCDRVIALKQQLLEEKRRQKQWLMYMIFEEQCLMPETTKELSFDEVFTTCSIRGHQIKTDQYVAKGLYPVVDQGKRPVVAFSDDKSKLLKCPQTGLIVFGDHTKELKFVDFDFIVGADGVQLICAKESVLTTEFGYYLLSAKKLPDDGYSRHFKYLKEFTYSVPDRDTQNQISSILRVIDKEIVLLETEFELWQQKKKALMQLLLTGLVRVNA